LTVNVGVLRGGTRPNVVADSAVIEVDVRSASRRDLESAEAAIVALATRATVADVETRVDVRSRHWPMEPTAASSRIVRMAAEAAAGLGFELHDAGTGGTSDGNTTSGLGVPTLDGLGPIGGRAHTPDEYLELDSVAPRTALLAALMAAIGRDPSLGRSRRQPGDGPT
jgi:glutamate carboxypeptidase